VSIPEQGCRFVGVLGHGRANAFLPRARGIHEYVKHSTSNTLEGAVNGG